MRHNDVKARPAHILIWKLPGPETRQSFRVTLVSHRQTNFHARRLSIRDHKH